MIVLLVTLRSNLRHVVDLELLGLANFLGLEMTFVFCQTFMALKRIRWDLQLLPI